MRPETQNGADATKPRNELSDGGRENTDVLDTAIRSGYALGLASDSTSRSVQLGVLQLKEVDVATATAAEFNRHPSQVKRAAEGEPVVITENSRPSFVLMTYAEYQRLLRTSTDLAEWLEMDEEIEFEIEPVGLDVRPANV